MRRVFHQLLFRVLFHLQPCGIRHGEMPRGAVEQRAGAAASEEGHHQQGLPDQPHGGKPASHENRARRQEQPGWVTQLLFYLYFLKLDSCSLTNFISASSQRPIWKRSSTAPRPTSSSLSSVSRCWRSSCRWCAGNWPTRWSNCRNSETSCRGLRASQTSGRPHWRN